MCMRGSDSVAGANGRAFGRRMCVAVVLALVLNALAPPSRAAAQAADDALLPAGAPNCRVVVPPDAAGIVVSPGGFILVHPRNDALGDGYTGCKVLWVVDVDRTPRLATLYFERGTLRRAIAHDVRDPSGAPEGACAFPEGRSLLPNSGRRLGDAACQGFTGESLYALRLPTWPRRCMATPEAAVCKADPR